MKGSYFRILKNFFQRFLGLDRNLQIYCLANVLNRFGEGLIGGGLFSIFLRQLGIEMFELGALSSLYAASKIVLGPIAGGLSDRYGRRRLILINYFGNLLTPFACLIATHWTWLLPALIMNNLLQTVSNPAYQAFVADVTKTESRQTAMGTLNTIMAAPMLIFPPVGGLLAELYGIRILFLIQFLFSLLGGLILFTFFRESMQSTSIKKEKSIGGWVRRFKGYLSSVRSGLSLITKEKRMNLTAIIIMLCLRDIEFGIHNYLWIYYKETLKTPYPMLGMLASIGALCYLLTQIPLGKLSDKYGRKPLIVSGMLLYASTLFAIPYIHNYYWLILIEALRTIGGPAHGQSITALTYDITPSQIRGTLFGVIYGPIRGSAQITGPIINGHLWTVFGGVTTIYFNSAICYLIGIIGLSMIKESKKFMKSID